MPRRSAPLLALLRLSPVLLAVGCSTTPDGLPEGRPLTPEEIAYEKSLQSQSVVARSDADRGRLLRELDQALVNWHQAQAEVLGSRERELERNYEEILQTKTYMNLDTLLATLRGDDPRSTAIAAAALGFVRLTEPADEDAREAFLERWPQRYAEVVGPLVDATRSADPRVVQNATMALSQIGDPETPIEPLVALLERPEAEIRSNAALALAHVLTPDTGDRAIGALLVAMNDADPKVRLHAISAVKASRHRNGVGTVAKLLGDRYELIAMNAAETLAEIGDVQSCGYLIARLKGLLGQTPSGKYRPVSDLDQRRQRLTNHLIAALEHLSGESHGDDIEDWEDWWQDVEGTS